MRMRFWLPGIYLALAVYVWIDFWRTNPDGLANVGLVVVVLPITLTELLVGWVFGESGFTLMPDGFGYYGNHALFYVPSVFLVSGILWQLGAVIDRRRSPT